MNDTATWLARLERESHAMKQGFLRTAQEIRLYTRQVSVRTEKNEVRIVSDYGSRVYPTTERVRITYDTIDGSDTLATLELTTTGTAFVRIRRVPYTGGARWMVSASPAFLGDGRDAERVPEWRPTEYTFTVHAMVKGVLRAENMPV